MSYANYAFDEDEDVFGGDDDDGYIDITDVFDNARGGTSCRGCFVMCFFLSKRCVDMEEEDVLLLDGFSLYDAMTAIEVNRTRLLACKYDC
jgi:hypothetical protein